MTAVADVTFGRGPSSINRYDRERRAVIGVDLESRYAMSSARETFLKVVDEQKLPASVRLQPSGDAEIQDEVATGFMTAMGTGLMIVFGVLVLLFGSVAQPITILLSLPLSFGGVVLALLATGNSVSMPVYIGLLMLMGIVTKNAIMLVDFAVEEVAKGVPRFDAVIDAGRKRARPIVMTTLAMVAGMIPSAMAIGDGGEFRAPMAIAVIGGLLVSTVLSLVFVPSFFTVMDDIGNLIWLDLRPLHRPDRRAAGVTARRNSAQPPRPGGVGFSHATNDDGRIHRCARVKLGNAAVTAYLVEAVASCLKNTSTRMPVSSGGRPSRSTTASSTSTSFGRRGPRETMLGCDSD